MLSNMPIFKNGEKYHIIDLNAKYEPEEYKEEVLDKQRYEGKDLRKKDFEILIEALQTYREAELLITDLAAKENQELKRKEHQGNVNRITLLIEMCTNEIKKELLIAFERRRKSKRWERALQFNTFKYCKETNYEKEN